MSETIVSPSELLCRSCLKQDLHMLNLFENFEGPPGQAMQLSNCFQIITELTISYEDNLPKQICFKCSESLKNAWNFREKSKQSDVALRLSQDTVVVVGDGEEEPDIKYSSVNDDGNGKPTAAELYMIEVNKLTEEEDSNYLGEEEAAAFELFKCKFCEDEFESRKELSTHILTNHKNVCRICKEPFSSAVSLRKHFLEHGENEAPFSCDLCEKTYFSKDGLKHHKLSHVEFEKEKKKKSKYTCQVCKKEFLTSQRLRIHSYVHTGEKNFPCSKCNKKFATEFRLKSHFRIHSGEKPYECDICRQRFAQGNALKCHVRIHTGERPYKCSVCNKSFSQNTILKTHMTLHNGKTVSCPDCDKMFSRKSYLILHRREHTGDKPYICEICPNRYYQKSHLDRHLDTHNGVKHRCEVCGKAYSKAWSLKVHSYSHTEDKPYNCPHCPTSFIRKDKYTNHLKRNHSDLTKAEVDEVSYSEIQTTTEDENAVEVPVVGNTVDLTTQTYYIADM